MKYSIIIPVYNGEKTISRCLDSVLTQNHPDTEIILINDGSADDTNQICEDYCLKYPEIRYFPKENGGVSSARNLGLSAAEGRYILFVDSDDWISEQYFSRIDRAVAEHTADLIQFSWESVDEDRTSPVILPERRLQGTKEIADWTMGAMRDGTFGSLWSKVFSGRIIRENSLRFPESLKIAEDWVFIFQYLLHVDSYCSVTDSLYRVSLENGDSLSRKKREYLAEQLYEANMVMYRSVKNRMPQARPFRAPLALSYYRSVYSSTKELHKFDWSNKERRKKIREICGRYAKGPVSAKGILPTVLSLPVSFRMAFLIDSVSGK